MVLCLEREMKVNERGTSKKKVEINSKQKRKQQITIGNT